MLNVKSFADAAYDEIKERIISGEYKPGDQLNERELSKDMGISRTPVRESLKKLTHEGWLTDQPYKKNQVRIYTKKDVEEIQSVRSSLEILALTEAFKNFTDTDISELQSLINFQSSLSDESNSIKFITADREFHEYIYLKSENSYLISILSNINDILRYFGGIAISNPGRQIESIEEHKKIFEAIKSKDLNTSCEMMTLHMDNTLKSIIDGFKDDDNFIE